MGNTDIIKKVHELRELQALIDEATQNAEAIKDELKAHMGNSEELRVGEYRITWKPVATARINTAALKLARPDIAAAFTQVSTSRRFTVA